MPISRVVAATAARLGSVAEARLLLCHVLGVEPSALVLAPPLSGEASSRLEEMLRRRESGEPIQHITGLAPFRTTTVEVGPGVFIPRPETEVMTGWALERIAALTAAVRARSALVPEIGIVLGSGLGGLADDLAFTRGPVHSQRAWEYNLRPRMLLAFALATPVVAVSMVPALRFPGWQWVLLVLTAVIVFWCGRSFHVATWNNLRHGTTTMDTLVSMGTLAAFGWSLYALFFGGNHAQIKISTPTESNNTLLVLKDSYANSFVPFLAQHYRKIIMIDPRYYYGDLEQLLQVENVQEVLYLYNANTFFADTSLELAL